MITLDALLAILKALAWPLVGLLLGLVFLAMFKNKIGERLSQLQKTKLPGGIEASFGHLEASADTEPVAKAEQLTEDSIKWSNSGNLFWVGYDLMWTIDVLLHGAPKERSVHGLRHFLYHVRSLGFTNTPIESKLAKLKADAENTLQKDWTPSLRDYYARELGSIGHHIGKLAEKNQSDYEPNPKE